MPQWCAAIGCNNVSSVASSVSFFSFPTDSSVRKQWLVNLRRQDFQPSEFSRVCSDHFTEGCFDPAYHRKKFFGVSTSKAKRKLLPGACPTIFAFNINQQPTIKRGALEKRHKREILFSDPFVPLKKGKRSPDVPVAAEPPTIITEPQPATEPESVLSNPGSPPPPSTNTRTSICQTDVCGENWTAERSTEKFSIGTMTRPREIRHFKAQHRPHCRSMECQTDCTNMKDMAIQCDMPPPSQPVSVKEEETLIDIGEEEEEEEDVDSDDEWVPDLQARGNLTSLTDEGDYLRNNCNPVQERKFLVFESSLLQLLMFCCHCFLPCKVIVKKVLGTFVLLRAVCSNGHIREWASQPLNKGMPLGNLFTASAVLFSGSSPAKVVTMCHHLRMQMLSIRTYFRLQSAYLCPAVQSIWLKQNKRMLDERKCRPVKLGGDGRCCSAGHTAKYGAYSLMDLETSSVIETQLIQSNEVKNSTAMELEGLKRCWDHVVSAEVEIAELVTDRHTQVKKYMREQQPKTKHHFDVWHMAKGVKKKLEATGKKKGLEVVGRWAHSLSNHMYWCAASSHGNGPMVQAKWLSLINHMCNIHQHEGLFPKCAHGDIGEREWLEPGSRATKNVEQVIGKTAFLKDLQKLAPDQQTSSLESFHNVVCHFAPKHGHFFFEAMESRLHLAVLHFNENSRRRQAETNDGSLQYGVKYGKSNKGRPVLKEVKVPITYEYVEQLMTAVFERRCELPSYTEARRQKKSARVVPVSAQYTHQQKADVVWQHKTRFNRTEDIE